MFKNDRRTFRIFRIAQEAQTQTLIDRGGAMALEPGLLSFDH